MGGAFRARIRRATGGGGRELSGVRSALDTSAINRTSPGIGRTITYGDRVLVLSELRQVICGQAVHKPVDNGLDVRITGTVLWTTCGCEKDWK
jgi:hypothetical protein